MNEGLQKQLAEAIAKALQVAEQTGIFVVNQAPELLREFYAWEIAKNILDLFWLPIALYFFAIFLPKKFPMADEDGVNYYEVDYLGRAVDGTLGVIMYCLGGIVVVTTGFFFQSSLINLIQLAVAPRLYLIEQLSKYL